MGSLSKAGRRTVLGGVLTPTERSISGQGPTKVAPAAWVFPFNSITKTLTALLGEILAAEGVIDLDAPVRDILPAWPWPKDKGRPITCRDLMWHRSGLPRLAANFAPRDWQDPYGDYTVDRMREFLATCELARAPGEKVEYSNTGYDLLGVCLATAAGCVGSMEGLFQRALFLPLNMDQATLEFGRHPRGARLPGHLDDREMPWWTQDPQFVGAGATCGTVGDLLEYGAAVVGLRRTGVDGPLQRLLESIPWPIEGRSTADRIVTGCGWAGVDRGGRRYHWHNGGSYGHTGVISCDRERGHVVVLQTDTVFSGRDSRYTDDHLALERASWDLLDRLRDRS